MIGETAFALYSKTAAKATCYNCFNTICQSVNVPSGNPYIFQNDVTYRNIQEQNVCSATDYFWRKYYSDLAIGFSKPFPTYFTEYHVLENSKNVENTFVQQSNILTSSFSEPKEFLKKNENVQLWRPFSPPPEEKNSAFSNETNRRIQIFPQRNSLNIIPSIHKLDHSTSSVFVPAKKKTQFCPHCPAAFFSHLQLLTHMRVHTGLKPFGCDHPNCSKFFARNEELTRHRRIHSGYKPHHCNSCGKSFGRKDHLSKHLKTHLQVSEKKVYVCRVSGCGHRYTRSDALTRHKSNAHAIPKSKTVAKMETECD